MIKTNKLKVIYFLIIISTYHQSSSMCFRKILKPVLRNIQLNKSHKRIFTTFVQKKINQKKVTETKSFSTEQIKCENTTLRHAFILNYDDLTSKEFLRLYINFQSYDDQTFTELLDLYRNPNKDQHSDSLKSKCKTILKNFSQKSFLSFCEIGCTAELECFFNIIAELIGESVRAGDKEFSDFLINWSLNPDNIKITQEYLKNKNIEDLVKFIKRSLSTDVNKYCYDFLKNKNCIIKLIESKTMLNKKGYIINY